MTLPSPENYNDWREYARVLVAALEAEDTIGAGTSTPSGTVPGGLITTPTGFRPAWWSIDDALLYMGNATFDPPTAPDLFQIDTTNLADAAIVTQKIADGAVDFWKIFDGAVGEQKLANLAVTNAKLGYAAVGSLNVIDGAIVTAKIANAAIVSALIGDAQVVTAKIADLAVNTAKMANLSVTSAKIGLLAVGNAHIEDAAVTNAKIGQTISSYAYDPSTHAGWIIDKAGNIEARSLKLWSSGGSQLGVDDIFTIQATVTTNTSNIGTLSANLTSEIGTRSSTDAVMAGQITTLNAYFVGFSGTTVQASVNSASVAYVTPLAAQTARIDTLNTYFVGFTGGTVQSAITSEASTRASADGALSTRTDALEARFVGLTGTVATNISTEATTRANADTAMATQITTLNAYFAGFTGTVQSAISNEATTRANADTALTTLVNTLRASYAGIRGMTPNADFQAGGENWVLTNVSAGNAGAGNYYVYNTTAGVAGVVQSAKKIRIDPSQKYRIHGKFETAGATNQSTLAFVCYNAAGTNIGIVYVLGWIGSFAVGTHIMDVTLTGTGATNDTQDTRFIAGTVSIELYAGLNFSNTASAVNYLQEFWIDDDSNAITARADIVTEASTRASADSAISSTVTTLSTTVGGHTSTLTTYGTSISGLQGKYGVTIDVNGYVTGYELNNGGGTSSFKVRADRFLITKSSGTGESAVFDLDATGLKLAVPLYYGNQTLIGSAGSYRLRHGSGFGVSSDLVLWYGLTSVALGSETKTNGVFALATDGIIYYGAAPLGGSTGGGAQLLNPFGTTSDTTLAIISSYTFAVTAGTLTIAGTFAVTNTATGGSEHVLEVVKADSTVVTVSSHTIGPAGSEIYDLATTIPVSTAGIWTVRVKHRRIGGSGTATSNAQFIYS